MIWIIKKNIYGEFVDSTDGLKLNITLSATQLMCLRPAGTPFILPVK